MPLKELGYDDWFDTRGRELLKEGQCLARVTAVDRNTCTVRHDSGEVPAELAGRFRHLANASSDLPCVGDWVCVQLHSNDTAALVHDVLPRRTWLRRKRPGSGVDYQMIASNIDVAFIVQSCHYDFNLKRLDRYLVMANEGGIEPVVVLSKTDLLTGEELERRAADLKLGGINCEVILLSNVSEDGLDAFKFRLAPGRTYSLVGSSGVGKTTLINKLLGEEVYVTKDVSGTGEGTHATTRRQLIMLGTGAMLVDTPGMRELGIVASDEGMSESFADIDALGGECRFDDCTHVSEPGCAILAAIERGDLSRERHENYLKLRKESAFNEMSYVDRRKKDRALGKYYKSAKKDVKKYKPGRQ